MEIGQDNEIIFMKYLKDAIVVCGSEVTSQWGGKVMKMDATLKVYFLKHKCTCSGRKEI